MTVLDFKGYRVTKMSYKRNGNFNGEAEVSYKPSFNSAINLNEETNEAIVILKFETPKNFPFKLKVNIEGNFKYNTEEDSQKIGAKRLLYQNALAILFPYLRVIVNQVSGLGNEYPPLLLPTVNIASLLNNEEIDKK
jgi:Preprotein translocase subunit SecB